jgi:hypothetical protein
MTTLDRWIAAFQTMDDRARSEYLDIAERAAKKYPRKSTARLTVVPGRVVQSGAFGKSLGSIENLSPPARIGTSQ